MKELVDTLNYYYTDAICTAETVEEQHELLTEILNQ